MLKDLSLNYFRAFSHSDIKDLQSYFADEICLRDWNVNVQGIELVIQQYQQIFQNLCNITVEVTELYEDGLSVIAELEISAIGVDKFKVVDILVYDCLLYTSPSPRDA